MSLYETGSWTSTQDLLNKFAAWLEGTPGWTRAHLGLINGYYYRYHATKGGMSVAFQTENDALSLHGATGVDIAANSYHYKQPGGPPWKESKATGLSSASKGPYHFFSDATGANIVLVVECPVGTAQWLGFGLSCVKAGSWTGGFHFGGGADQTNFLHFIKADLDGLTDGWVNTSGYASEAASPAKPSLFAWGSNYCPSYAALAPYAKHTLNGALILLPSMVAVTHTENGQDYYAPFADHPMMFLTRLDGRASGTVIAFGSDIYLAFTAYPADSEKKGFAVRKL